VTVPNGDISSMLSMIHDAMHAEMSSMEQLLNSKIDAASEARVILLDGLETRTRLLQEEIDRRFSSLQNLMDERRDSSLLSDRLLQEELDRRMSESERMNSHRHNSLRELMINGQHAAHEAVAAALASAEKAVGKAELAAERRFESVNEFRKTLSDQTSTFIPRAEYDASNSAIESKVSINSDRVSALELRLTSRLDRGEGSEDGANVQRQETRLNVGAAVSIAALLITVLTFIILYVIKK
jgi:hypothetical protein